MFELILVTILLFLVIYIGDKDKFINGLKDCLKEEEQKNKDK